jgi:hypothetical protein
MRPLVQSQDLHETPPGCHPGERRDLRRTGLAVAGIMSIRHEIPAFAGMTAWGAGFATT